jgi:hypothetical protein
MLEPRAAFDLAVRNIARWGDTDVFPFAPENHAFHDRHDEIVNLLLEIDADLDAALLEYPANVQGALSLVTYEGLRWVSQIDPLWNAYFLGLALRIADDIEKARPTRDRGVVFSYRVEIDDERASLFSEAAWHAFGKRSAELTHEHTHVVLCDIADFYSRIYHHRLKNALQLLPASGEVPAKLEQLVSEFSGGPSYGLPVGGPAARILAELALNRTDRLLMTRGVRFVRYADDYRLFANSRNEAFQALVFLSEVLLRHEGLTLQKQKTRVLETTDFARLPILDNVDEEGMEPREREERRFLRLSLRYDPYAPHAEEDYERLKESLRQFDILGMLTREVEKSRVNITIVRRLVQAIRHLDEDVRNAAAETLVDNLEALAPALPVTLRVLETLYPELPKTLRIKISETLRAAIHNGDYYLLVPVNRAYALRALRHDRSEENISLADELFDSAEPFIQRDIVYLMHGWSADHWLSDKRRQWNTQHPWVKRALLLASFALGDEGSHWRRAIKSQIRGFDRIALDWMRARVQAKHRDIPI